MRTRWRKLGLVGLAVVLLVSAATVQRALNTQRSTLGLTRIAPLENAPPILAFTTVALGGFRGLIANALWIRANDLQNDGKYFEMVQLADWITKLEPTFVQVWTVQAWNMAYNISVKFPNPQDRWRWVQRGIELLRDEGLRYNPKEALLYRELGWFFQHKMGQNMDDAHLVYKFNWAVAMTNLFGGPKPNFPELRNPSTPEAKRRADELRARYKMDPAIMQEVDQLYGPLEWRLPEAHAIYWGHVGLKHSRKEDLITLRRLIYQSMQMSVLRGRLISLSPLRFGPDLDKAPRANASYEQMIAQETEMKHAVQSAHKSFLRELVYLFYIHNRLKEANEWFTLLKQKYPEMVPRGMSMEELSLLRYTENLSQAGHDRMKAILEGILSQYWISFAFADDDPAEEQRAIGYDAQARYVWNFYAQRSGTKREVLAFPPFEEMKKDALDVLLKTDDIHPEVKRRLRAKLGLPAPAVEPATPPAR